MAPDDRRRAIVEAVVPLLLEHGPDVTTRQVAEAAGIAEGTIFRVFPDKASLLVAAAEETMSPVRSGSELLTALDGAATLREKVLLTAERMNARTDRVMAVMFALRRLGPALPAHDGDHHPPDFVQESARALQRLLTEVFEPHRDELSVDPGTAALLLRTLVLGSRHPGAFHDHTLTCDEITDVLLDGIRRREPGRREED